MAGESTTVPLTRPATADAGIHMYNQATYGPVDVLTGDYLAGLSRSLQSIWVPLGADAQTEATLGGDALKRTDQSHPGWVPTALAGIEISLDVVNEKRIKIVVNGGSLNPKGLAEKVHSMVRSDSPLVASSLVWQTCLMM